MLAPLHIDSIAAGGDGVGRSDGVVVFVPRTAPGDEAMVDYTIKGRFARGRLERLTTPSPARVEPPCPHYTIDRCGGCQLQHLAYAGQLDAKRGIVRDALTRIARRPAEPEAVRASAREWRYRRKLTLAMRWSGGRWVAGLHPHDRPDAVFELRDCPITEEPVLVVWREVLAASALLPRARELRGAVRLLDEGASFVLEGGERWAQHRQFVDAVPSLSVLWWAPEERDRRMLLDRRAHGSPGAAFAQVNEGVAREMQRYVVEQALARSPRTVIDAYAGAGDTAVPIAEAGAAVTAIELNAEAAAWGARRLPEGSRSLAGRVEALLPEALPADIVILNPPRGGVHERVCEMLSAARPAPRALIYVSCNPATLARDLGRLPGFAIESVQPFDMFPQTAHVETVCVLVPAA